MHLPGDVPVGIASNNSNPHLQQRRRLDVPSSISNPNTIPSAPGYQPPGTPTSPAVTSADKDESTTKDLTAEQFIRKQIKNLRNELSLLISIPFLLLVGYGGRPAILTLAFGSLACYILDVLEAIEVS